MKDLNQLQKKSIREWIYTLVQTDTKATSYNKVYNGGMILAVLVSILPLCVHSTNEILVWIERITTALFLIDYLLRWMTADMKYRKREFVNHAFLIYPFRFHAMIDLIAILPAITSLHRGLKLLKIVRALKCMRVFKVLKYSSSFNIISKLLRKQKKALTTVCYLAIAYIFISAIFVFQTEPETFPSFFDAIYWAVISLTTVGYGDIYPITKAGKIISMISAIFGIAFVALPAGIISGGYLEIVMEQKNEEKKKS